MNEDNNLIEKVEQHDETIKEHTELLHEHTTKIQRLEDNDLHMQLQMSEIQKSQMKIELIMIENSNTQNKTLNEFMNKILDTFTSSIKNNNKTSNKIRLIDRKELWGILGAIVTFIITYFSNN